MLRGKSLLLSQGQDRLRQVVPREPMLKVVAFQRGFLFLKQFLASLVQRITITGVEVEDAGTAELLKRAVVTAQHRLAVPEGVQYGETEAFIQGWINSKSSTAIQLTKLA